MTSSLPEWAAPALLACYRPYVQAGFRRLAILGVIPFLGDYLRVSALGALRPPFGGAAFHQIAPQSISRRHRVGLELSTLEGFDALGNRTRVTVGSDCSWTIEEMRWKNDSSHWRCVILPSPSKRGTISSIKRLWSDLPAPALTLDLFYLYDRWFH